MKRLTGMMIAALVMAASSAHAGGLLLDASALPDEVRAAFSEEIAKAKAADPAAFAAVRQVAERIDTYDRQKRGRMAPISAMLKHVGARAVWPAVELLAFDAPPASQRPSARLALEVGLIEVAGGQRDARLMPLWTAISSSGESRVNVLRAALGAMARLETDDAAQKLVALSRTDGPAQLAALGAMGHCRRLTVARALAEHLEAQPADAVARQVISSLADAGNAWAWRTPSVKARSEEGAVRRVAAQALVRAFVAYSGEVRQAASNALLVVDAPETAALIAEARKAATEENAAALDALDARLAKNPLRTGR